MNLTEHFSIEEVTASRTASEKGIDNTLPRELLPAVERIAIRMEKVRSLIGHPININSWYRCPALNEAVGSKPTSQHLKGEAVDFVAPAAGTPLEICKFLIRNRDLIRWDQLIMEHTWVHISWNSIPSGEQRGQVLSLLETGKYATGLTDLKGNPL